MRARGGVLHYHLPNTSTPLSSLANTSRGWVFPYHLLPPTHPPRPQTRAGGWGFALPYHPPNTTNPTSSHANGGGICLTTYLQPPPHPPCPQTRAEGGFCLTIYLPPPPHPQPPPHPPRSQTRAKGVLPYHLPTTSTPPSSLAKT